MNTPLTDNAATAQAALDGWSAGGGGDFPEANLIALSEQAEATDWRADSTRFAIQFGDAPGHAGGTYPTEAETIDALNDANVTLLVLGTNSMLQAAGGASPDAARTIAEATGGSFNLLGSGVDLADTIDDAITAAFAEYEEVALGLIGSAPGVDILIEPISFTGDFDRSVDREFNFDVTFTGLTEGLYEFEIGALVDGGLIATESDRIIVGSGDGGGGPIRGDDGFIIPLPPTLPLMLGALLVGGIVARRRAA